MFCKQCGTQIEEGLAFCPNCGTKQGTAPAAPVNESVPAQPIMNEQYAAPNSPFAQPSGQQGYAQPNATASGSPKKVTFGEAIKLFFVNYVNFTGRSTVSEYWWAFLFNFIVSFCTAWIPGIGQLISFGLLLPGIAVGVRRLHDTGKSWVYMLMGLIPLAGAIILIVQYCKESDADNQWGPAARD